MITMVGGRLFYQVIHSDLLLMWRRPGAWLNPLLFFVVVVSLFPLAVSPDQSLLVQIAPGIIWVAALLACLIALDDCWRDDFADGMLEQFVVSRGNLAIIVLAKMLVHWMSSGLPLLLVAPLLGIFLQLNPNVLLVLSLSLFFGTLTLSLIGGLLMALLVGLRNANLLLALLVLPLYVPVLIFGSSAVILAIQGISASGQLALLAALFLLSLISLPFATAGVLRIGFM